MRLADGRAESPLESALQVEIRTDGRLVGVVDAWFGEAAVAVEFDGEVKYRDPWRGRTPGEVLWAEKRREDELRSLDIRVVRVADRDLDRSWPVVERRRRALLSGPGATSQEVHRHRPIAGADARRLIAVQTAAWRTSTSAGRGDAARSGWTVRGLGSR